MSGTSLKKPVSLRSDAVLDWLCEVLGVYRPVFGDVNFLFYFHFILSNCTLRCFGVTAIGI